jgi:hypothetical protein
METLIKTPKSSLNVYNMTNDHLVKECVSEVKDKLIVNRQYNIDVLDFFQIRL